MTNRETVVAARQCTEFTLLFFVVCVFVFFVEFVRLFGNAIKRLEEEEKKNERENYF